MLDGFLLTYQGLGRNGLVNIVVSSFPADAPTENAHTQICLRLIQGKKENSEAQVRSPPQTTPAGTSPLLQLQAKGVHRRSV